ncbi:MAG TPA: hypothetical protein VGM06_05595 [Polyangiaceae bacterium]|jgi:galactosylceramidase
MSRRPSIPFLIGLSAGVPALLLASGARAQQTVTISTTDTGSKYEGIGAVSGGGATSVLLHDYVEPQRSDILDYLFKPNYGAAIQELYVEIGGDGNSTQGSESSHEHTPTDKNFNRGYEWWLMEQARARNPNILLDVTAWSAPGWVGNGTFFSQETTTYLADYIAGAKSAHGLDLDYVGCRNEKGIDESFLETFRTTLDAAGIPTGIHGFDNWNYATGAASPWNWVLDLTTNATLATDVYAIGEHTTWGDAGAPTADVVAAAKAAGKSIWDTEEHIYEHGFQCEMDIARSYLQNYTQSGITKTIYWYLITAFYPIEPFYDVTMAVASSPWSGAYTINDALWGYAHLTQFAQPGWQFLDHASGTLSGGGDYVTLLSPNGTDFSVVADTAGATAAQEVTFVLPDGLSPASVNVWQSDATAQFQQMPAVPVAGGSFTVAMEANAIYSITTTTGQTKGAAATPPPAASAFPFPYYENYDHYGDFTSVGYRPYYHADIAGTFELAERPDGTGQCLHQVVVTPAQSWAPEPSGPYTIVGDRTWSNYEVSVDVSIPSGGWAALMGRVGGVGSGYGTGFAGYFLTLDTTGAWGFYNGMGADTNNTTELTKTLASGTATLAAGDWHNLKLVFSGTSIQGLVDATQVFSITDASFLGGQVGLATQSYLGSYTPAYFDNLIVNTVGGAPPAPTPFTQDAQNGIDAGTPATVGTDAGAGDAGPESDAATGAKTTSTKSKGCSCTTVRGSEGGDWSAGALFVAAIGLGRSRRSARRGGSAAGHEAR